MEALWDDLSHNADSIQSPAWHKNILQQRAQRVASGEEVAIDWKNAKEMLRVEISK